LAPASIEFGIALMDQDHERLENLLERAAGATDAALPSLLLEIEAEVRSHFDREEDLIRSTIRSWPPKDYVRGVPLLSAHIVQHTSILSKFVIGRDAKAQGDMTALRHFLANVLPQLMYNHLASEDRVAAALLREGTVPE
jgi:hemerythrin